MVPTHFSNPTDEKKLLAAVLLASLIVLPPSMSFAEEENKPDAAPEHSLTGNFGVFSEYRYRGISQTNGKPAAQGGVDYANASGFYVGTWASNVSWLSDQGRGASSSLEWDFYGGYKGTAGALSYDLGGLYYDYPGTYPASFIKPNTFELYAAATYGIFTLKYSQAITNIFGFADSKGSGYLDLSATYDLGNGMALVGHVGNQVIVASASAERAKSDCSYVDYKLGLTKDLSGYVFGLAYIGTNAKADLGQCYRNAFNNDLGKGTALLSVVKSF
jgi:uncharacterized protein (TIGR02001 family)